MEGLLYYLEEPGVRRLLQGVSDCTTSGSVLAAELVSASYFRSPHTQKVREMMATYGIAWHWGSDDPEDFFNEFGWSASVSQPGDADANFGRWTSALISRDLRELPHTFLVSARKK
jgi:O-methyltransferase involved in polyketide biosynthesis